VWESFQASGFTYGSPRIWLDLREAGWRVSVNTVAAPDALDTHTHLRPT
jgi:HTH-like domain